MSEQTHGLTPTQDLIMDVLAARLRTGEHLWTFSSRQTQTAEALETRGLVSVMSGAVEYTIRVRLTDAGQKLVFGSTYISPIEKELAMVRGQLKEIRDLRALEAEHRSGPNW
jgi:DNA-binding MarR family transcriptional regulator